MFLSKNVLQTSHGVLPNFSLCHTRRFSASNDYGQISAHYSQGGTSTQTMHYWPRNKQAERAVEVEEWVTGHFAYEKLCLLLEQFAYWISHSLCTYTVIQCTTRIALYKNCIITIDMAAVWIAGCILVVTTGKVCSMRDIQNVGKLCSKRSIS